MKVPAHFCDRCRRIFLYYLYRKPPIRGPLLVCDEEGAEMARKEAEFNARTTEFLKGMRCDGKLIHSAPGSYGCR